MKRLMEALNQAQHKAAEAMYRSAGPAGLRGAETGAGAGSGPGTTGGAARESGDVIDAEVVEEEKK